jgi:DNA processing protein
LDSTFDLLTLALLPGSHSRTARDLAARVPLAEALSHPEDHGDLLAEQARHALRSGEARRAAETEHSRCAGQGIRIVGWDEAEYPPLLRHTYDPPPVLWMRGSLQIGEGPRAVALVGARAASPLGAAFARTLARDLAGAGATVVSGLARGIDTAAHEGALAGKGRTVAVLGSGLGCLYPPENEGLAARLAGAGGAVVSEFPFGFSPQPRNFPRRNRVIAGWGVAVVVVEAGERSGALGTARCALDEGREVLAVPGHPTFEGAVGTNALLRDGAALVRSAADVAEALGWSAPAPEVPAAEPLLRAWRPGEPLTVDELSSRSGTPAAQVLRQLSELEMLDKVRRLPGALYVRD